MPVKIEVISRWEVRLDGDTTVPTLSVNSIDTDKKSVKIRLGAVERILTVEDWISIVNAVAGKFEHTATR